MADFKFRHGTYDASIFNHVFEQNEYEIASLKGKRLLDIGGHIGSFALKAVSHGADYVVSFEPNQDNYDLLFHNVMSFENAEAHRLAITRSDKEVEVRFEASDNPVNSGGGCSVTGLGEVVPSMSLDDAIDKWNPSILKIDAEEQSFLLFTLAPSLIRLTPFLVSFTMPWAPQAWVRSCLKKTLLNSCKISRDVCQWWSLLSS